MTVHVAFVGTSISLIEADDVEHARWHVAYKSGYGHKPWLTRDLNIREATANELESFLAQGARVTKAERRRDKPSAPKGRTRR